MPEINSPDGGATSLGDIALPAEEMPESEATRAQALLDWVLGLLVFSFVALPERIIMRISDTAR